MSASGCAGPQCPPHTSASGVRTLVAFPCMSWSYLSRKHGTVKATKCPGRHLASFWGPWGSGFHHQLCTFKQCEPAGLCGVSGLWSSGSSAHVLMHCPGGLCFPDAAAQFGCKAVARGILSQRVGASRGQIQLRRLLVGTDLGQRDSTVFKNFTFFLVSKVKCLKVHVICACCRKVENELN